MGRSLKQEIGADEIAKFLGLELRGRTTSIQRIASRSESGAGSLGFVKALKFADFIPARGVVITLDGELAAAALAKDTTVIVSSNPRLDFALALAHLEESIGFNWSSDPAVVHPTASVGRNVVLGNGVRIGAHTRVLHNVVIGDEVTIGERCLIKSGAVIGEPGFGFERKPDGTPVRLAHLGTVRIGDDAEVGSLTTVCRGTLEDTLLLDGAKVDDHVHIAHNVIVGRDSLVVACAEISGGVTIGDRVWVAPNASVINQLTIGDRAVIGLGSVVLKNVLEDQVIVGNPGKPLAKK